MKKILTLCVVCFVAASLVGCGGSSAPASKPPATGSTGGTAPTGGK
jgi:hypothetical protein